MKRLQRHQGFEAELEANRSVVEEILQRGSHLQRGPNGETVSVIRGYFYLYCCFKVSKQCASLSSRWRELERACAEQSRALEEARDLLRYLFILLYYRLKAM